jgi:hypothetical protein
MPAVCHPTVKLIPCHRSLRANGEIDSYHWQQRTSWQTLFVKQFAMNMQVPTKASPSKILPESETKMIIQNPETITNLHIYKYYAYCRHEQA